MSLHQLVCWQEYVKVDAEQARTDVEMAQVSSLLYGIHSTIQAITGGRRRPAKSIADFLVIKDPADKPARALTDDEKADLARRQWKKTKAYFKSCGKPLVN